MTSCRMFWMLAVGAPVGVNCQVCYARESDLRRLLVGGHRACIVLL